MDGVSEPESEGEKNPNSRVQRTINNVNPKLNDTRRKETQQPHREERVKNWGSERGIGVPNIENVMKKISKNKRVKGGKKRFVIKNFSEKGEKR